MLLLCFAMQAGYSQSIDTAKLNTFFKALDDNQKFMGSIAVSRDGKLLYAKSVGYSDVDNKSILNENTMYRIGSITKTFTATLVMKAVEQGKLKLDQTINKYFFSLPNADKITIRHLLHHRSGVHDFTNDEAYPGYMTQPKTKAQMLDYIIKGGSDFAPDSKAEYSNSNYVLLTYVLEEVFKQPYPSLLKKYIYDPAKLVHTFYGGTIEPTRNEAYSYSFVSAWIKESETNMSIPMGAGGIVSTPLDLIRFADALYNGKLITMESLQQMKMIQDGYGMGMIQVPFNEKKGYGHGGSIDGFQSLFYYFPEDKVSFALTSNGTNYNNNDISIAVLSAVFNLPIDIPVFTSYPITAGELEPLTGLYSSEQIPVEITITQEGKILIAQGTGQSSFSLEATAPNQFKFDRAGIVLEFNVEDKTMLLKQGGGEFLFKKK
ncbi:MAG: beta-lactamase family protein [Bacteroidota bacterium]|nr:beta-lactamase family protein [Bacteroidota bacterium]